MIDDERIGAFVDDEMGAAEADTLARRAQGDPALREAIDRQARLRRKLRGSYASVMDQAPPPRLMAVLAAPPSRPAMRQGLGRPRWRIAVGAGLALAASVAIAFGVGAQLSFQDGVAISSGGRLAARGGLAKALDRQLGAEPATPASEVRVIESFKTPDGRYCRLFQAHGPSGVIGLACKDAGGWAVAGLTAGRPSDGATFRQAGSRLPRAIVASMDEAGVSEPLTADEERLARANGWASAARAR